MPNFLPQSVQNLIDQFSKLPGIGPKSAQRLAIHLLHSPESKTQELGKSVLDLRKNVIFCQECWNIAEHNPCSICTSEIRNKSQICVVENILDVVALEKTGEFKGVYHVLHGALSPVDGIGPDQLKMASLFARIAKSSEDSSNFSGNNENLNSSENLSSLENQDNSQKNHQELIIATNPSLEGEATALYIQRQLQNFVDSQKLAITRIARGLPVGGDLEYADEVTLSRALKGRSTF